METDAGGRGSSGSRADEEGKGADDVGAEHHIVAAMTTS